MTLPSLLTARAHRRPRKPASQAAAGPAALDGRAPAPLPGVALHHQIKEDMFLHLRSGRWPPGHELPTEEALCKHYGVSRGTLRQAILDLVSAGYIERKRGRGTFVSRPKLESGVAGSYSRFRVLGPPLDAGGTILACERIRADKDVATMLDVRTGAAIWRLERVRFTERRPVALQTSFIPVELATGLADHDLTTRHLVDVLRDEFGIHLVRAVEYIDPTVADGYAAKALGVRLRTPLFQIERSTYAMDDRVVEYRRALLRGDAYRYRLDLR